MSTALTADRNARTGRRSRALDPLVVERLVEAAAACCSPEEAAALAGIGRSTYFAWLARGRQAREARDSGAEVLATETPFLDLLDHITRARAEQAIHAVAAIHAAADRGQWRAAAWFLERSYPERWGAPSRRHPQPPPAPAPVDLSPQALADRITFLLDQHRG